VVCLQNRDRCRRRAAAGSPSGDSGQICDTALLSAVDPAPCPSGSPWSSDLADPCAVNSPPRPRRRRHRGSPVRWCVADRERSWAGCCDACAGAELMWECPDPHPRPRARSAVLVLEQPTKPFVASCTPAIFGKVARESWNYKERVK